MLSAGRARPADLFLPRGKCGSLRLTETWLSGRKRLTANEVGSKSSRGFESLRLRI